MKICPKCQSGQQDTRLVVCPTCKLPFREPADLEPRPQPLNEKAIAEALSASQLEKISDHITKSWRFRLILVGLLVVSILLSVPTVVMITMRGANNEIQRGIAAVRQQTKSELAAASNETARQFQAFAQDASNQVQEAHTAVTNQILQQLQIPKVRETVESVARAEAQTILRAEVQPAVDAFRADALFIRTVARAQAYDFKAYQELLEIGSQTNDNAKLASQALVEIERLLQRDRSDLAPRRALWQYAGTNTYKGPFSSDEIALMFPAMQQDRTSFNREGFANAVAELKQPLFLAQLVHFFTNETDLAVADRLAIAISALGTEDFHPRDLARIQTWWKARSDSCTNWPTEVLEIGLKEFSSVHYAEAAEAFGRVLKFDPGADLSRAHAIACSWEVGDTNQAAALAKGFKNPSARWAQWAAAKAELEAGNTSNATVQFACITTNFPTMAPLPNKQSHVFRKVDWNLFEKLTGTKAP